MTCSVMCSPLPAARQLSLPTAVCSVVWTDGHPYVLDGEPGIGGPRRWVGLDDAGQPQVRTPAELQEQGWSLVHDDRGAQRGLCPHT